MSLDLATKNFTPVYAKAEGDYIERRIYSFSFSTPGMFKRFSVSKVFEVLKYFEVICSPYDPDACHL